MDVFEFWVPDNDRNVAATRWSPYLVPTTCPTCGSALRLCNGSAVGPFNALDNPCHHMTCWSDLRSVSTPKKQAAVVCTYCKLVNEQAEPNQPDGGYVCYNCRN